MRGKIALALVALAAGLAACGDSEDAEPLATVGPPTKVAPARSPRSNGERDCFSQGIDTRTLNEGTCTEGTTQYVVVNRGTPLRLESLVLSLDDIAVESEVGRGDDAVRSQNGAFLRFTLTVRNLREYAQRFELGQTIVGIDEETFTEAEAAERAHPGSLSMRGDGRIEPGGTLRGDVLFDVPLASVKKVSSDGRLFVANFGEKPGERDEEGEEEQQTDPRRQLERELARTLGVTPAASTQLGQMRLYAAPPSASDSQ